MKFLNIKNNEIPPKGQMSKTQSYRCTNEAKDKKKENSQKGNRGKRILNRITKLLTGCQYNFILFKERERSCHVAQVMTY